MSIQSKAVDFYLRHFFDAKKIFGDSAAGRVYIDRLLAEGEKPYLPPERISSLPCSVTGYDYGGMQYFSVRPTDAEIDPSKLIFYLPGGAYIRNPQYMQFRFISSLASRLHAQALCVIYPKAPFHDFEYSYARVIALYRHLLENYSSQDIVLLGDSAGAGLALGLCECFIEDGTPLPGSLVLLSPFVDCTVTNPAYRAAEKTDSMNGVDGMRVMLPYWYGDADPHDKRLSPLFSVCEGLPYTVIFSGTDEMIHSDAKKLDSTLSSCHVCHTAHFYDSMGHDFIFYPIPEARDAMNVLVSDLMKSVK